MRADKPKAKLTAAQVQDILASKELGKVLAHRYGVTASNISAIRTGKSWKDVPWPAEQKSA